MGKLTIALILLVSVAMAYCAEDKKSDDTSVMMGRLYNYAKSWLSEKATGARIFFDDEDFEGIIGLVIGGIFLLILLSIIPGILSIFIGPLLMLLQNNNANTGTTGLLGNGLLGNGLVGLGAGIPTINVNEAATGRKRRETAGMGFPNKLADRIAEKMKTL